MGSVDRAEHKGHGGLGIGKHLHEAPSRLTTGSARRPRAADGAGEPKGMALSRTTVAEVTPRRAPTAHRHGKPARRGKGGKEGLGWGRKDRPASEPSEPPPGRRASGEQRLRWASKALPQGDSMELAEQVAPARAGAMRSL